MMGYNILSLFDGMSCGQIALEKSGIQYNNYYASEIDPHSKLVTQYNYPDTIQLGDVCKVNGYTLPKIDILLAGSPCQDLSKSNPDGDGLNGEKSKLFWEFVRLLKETNPQYFLLENVIMLKKWENLITEILGVKPIEINSNLVSAQNRRRLYWTNIPIDELPDNKYLSFKDIVNYNNYKTFKANERIIKTKRITKNKTYIQWDLNGKGHKSQQNRAYFLDGKICTLARTCSSLNICLDYDNDIYRKLDPIEAERLQTVPDNYTLVNGVSTHKRFEMLGNGWTVSIISHIFKNIPKIKL